MLKERYAISVIMPVYNSKNYLKAAVMSVLEQDFDDFELILVDDGSSDGSEIMCDEFAEMDERVRVIHQQNAGACAARNKAIRFASGRYIAFVDDDDLAMDGFLKNNYENALKYDSDIVKFGRIADWLGEDGQSVYVDKRELDERLYDRIAIRKNYYELRNRSVLSPVWDGLFRRFTILKYDIHFNESLHCGEEDTIFCLEFLQYADRLSTNPGIYYHHYIRESHSASASFCVGQLEKYMISASVERRVSKKIGAVDTDGTLSELCLLKNQLIPMLIKLYQDGCDYSYNKKRSFVRYIRKRAAFQGDINRKQYKALFSKDSKKALVSFLFRKNYVTLLLFVVKYYSRVLEKKLAD